jgi:outer membrane protein assembly factor BamB
MIRRLAALLVIVPFVASLDAAETNWQRFRGPNGTGIAADKDIPLQWTEKDGLVWKVAIPGDGNSSPVIHGNKIFLQSSRENERVLYCLSTEDGKVLWSQSVPGAKARIHKLSSLASSTPATDGEKVYTLFWNGTTVTAQAYDFAGKPVWKRDLGAFDSQHGYGASPVVYNGLIYVNNDQDGKATLIALDAKDGHIAWQKKRKAFRACYSTPFILEDEGKPVELIVTSTAGITAYNPKTGDEIWNWTWKFDGMALRTVASSVHSKGMIFASSGDGKGDRHAVGIKKGVKGDVTKTNLVWENKKSLPYVPCMIPWGEHLYFTNDKGMAGCVEAKTGNLVYFQRLAPGNILASPVLIDGKVYAVSEKGEVVVFPADPMFRVLAKTSLGEPVIASPAVAGGRLYIRGAEHLFCIGKTSSSK